MKSYFARALIVATVLIPTMNVSQSIAIPGNNVDKSLSILPSSDSPIFEDLSSNFPEPIPSSLESTCQSKVCFKLNLRQSSTGRFEPSASIQFTLGSHQAQKNRVQKLLAQLKVREFEHSREIEVLERLAKSLTKNDYQESGLWLQLLSRIRGTSSTTLLSELKSIRSNMLDTVIVDTSHKNQ